MSSDLGRLSYFQEKEDLIDAVVGTFGNEPPGIRRVLAVLSHPDVVKDAIRFLKALDKKDLCTIYTYPWNCVREAEARFETIRQDMIGAGLAGDFSELWCKNCRERAAGD